MKASCVTYTENLTVPDGPLPLAKAFYSFWIVKDDVRYEYRYWHMNDTRYEKTVYAIRRNRTDARETIDWKFRSAEWLGDSDFATRNC